MNSSWQQSFDDFKQKVMPRLEKVGRAIGADSLNNPQAKEIIELYSMLHRSFDPMTATILEAKLTEYETAQNIPSAPR